MDDRELDNRLNTLEIGIQTIINLLEEEQIEEEIKAPEPPKTETKKLLRKIRKQE